MKYSLSRLVAVAVVLTTFVGLTHANDPTAKTVTLTGTLACAQCQLHEQAVQAHQDLLLVKDGGKEVAYFLTGQPKHANVCHQRIENVKVTGSVEEKHGEKWLTVVKFEIPTK